MSLYSTVALLSVVTLYISCVDLLSEAVYSRDLRNKPSRGPALISFVWSGIAFAEIAAVLLAGYMLTVTGGSPWGLFAVAVIPAALVVAPTVMNCMRETKLSSAQVQVRR